MATGTPYPQDLADQSVVVIGASSGIGLATARQVRRRGGRVVMAGRDPRRLERAAEEVGAERSAPLDAADTGRLREFFGALPGPVDHVVSTAGSPSTRRSPTSTWARRAPMSVSGWPSPSGSPSTAAR